MNVWAGPREYVHCHFPLQEAPEFPGEKLRPTLVLGRFHTVRGRYALVIAQRTGRSLGDAFSINVQKCTHGLSGSDSVTMRWLDLREYMVLDEDDREFFPDRGRKIGSLCLDKFQDVIATVRARRLKPRMRAVQNIAPAGLREFCAEKLADPAFGKNPTPVRYETALRPARPTVTVRSSGMRISTPAPSAAQHPPRPR